MMEFINTYSITVYALGAMALLMVLQLLVADIVSIKHKRIPGTPIKSDHADFLFRVNRVTDNTNESIAIFILAILFCILSAASPTYTAYAAWGFVISRICFMFCYYLNVQLLRSVCFVFSLIALIALLLVGVAT